MKPKIQKPKGDLRQKKYYFMMWFNKETMKISEVCKFSIWPCEQN